jgi:hypothetical protein
MLDPDQDLINPDPQPWLIWSDVDALAENIPQAAMVASIAP